MSNSKIGANLFSPILGLDDKALSGLEALGQGAEQRRLSGGEILIKQGEPSDALYFVLSGRFGVHLAGTEKPIAEIGQGQPIGEIGFFAELNRTATVKAMRDSRVLVITRERYEALEDSSDEIRDAVIVSLARRLSGSVNANLAAPARVRTLAVLSAGGSPVQPRLIDGLRSVFDESKHAIFLTHDDIEQRFAQRSLEDRDISDWLNSLETEFDFVFYIADQGLTDWTKKCIRQADAILLVARAGAPTELNNCEQFAFSVHSLSARRLAIVHDVRSQIVAGTSSWLRERQVLMHHHVALEDAADVRGLYRFISGAALGFVAGGGGARGSAHLGVYKAFCEAGAEFDILGGTSSGAAMMAALAYGVEPERVDRGTHNIFIERRAFRRPTLPRYSLVDHKIFDAALKAEYGDVLIEDLWRPYFAVSCNLNNYSVHVHRTGPVWHAVRASGSIPAVLPPFFTRQGEMLVDGALADNVPVVQMKQLKAGPNVVVALGTETASSYDVDYESIPGAKQLVASIFNPFLRRRPPQAPTILQVIMRSMLGDQNRSPPLDETDILIRPELPADLRFIDWERHTEVFMTSYVKTASWLQNRINENDSKLLAIFGSKSR